MFKKILAVFIGFVCISNIAMAAVQAREYCVLEGKGMIVGNETSGSERPAIRADYVIHFDNDEFKIPTDCSPEVDEIVQKLRKQKDDIDAILMFGSADATGTANHNAKLAQDRVNTVAKLLEGNDFTDEQLCMYGSDGKVNSSRCARVTMGDSFGRERGYLESSEIARAVFMYVIYKRDICGETAAVLDALIDKITDTTVKTELQKVRAYCPDGDEDHLLTQSQRNEIMSAINHAIENYPEVVKYVTKNVYISSEEKVRLLNNSIIVLGNEYNNNRSVWKTADGDFNYARLASDSIAGVVLGTAGGLITSKVVKKNQLKRGFENVSCTIGGQSVASYGDEFTVGLQELK